MSKITAPEPAVGQVWTSNDRRDVGHEMRVIAVDSRYVRMVRTDGSHPTRVLRERMRPISTGYRLVRDASDADA